MMLDAAGMSHHGEQFPYPQDGRAGPYGSPAGRDHPHLEIERAGGSNAFPRRRALALNEERNPHVWTTRKLELTRAKQVARVRRPVAIIARGAPHLRVRSSRQDHTSRCRRSARQQSRCHARRKERFVGHRPDRWFGRTVYESPRQSDQ